MCINHGGGHIVVAEQFLDCSNIASRFQQMGGKRMAQGVNAHMLESGYLWAFISDDTEKIRLQSIGEAVATMNSLGAVFSGIRHELGNPLNSVKMTLRKGKKWTRPLSGQ